jgi:hypothetical protein
LTTLSYWPRLQFKLPICSGLSLLCLAVIFCCGTIEPYAYHHRISDHLSLIAFHASRYQYPLRISDVLVFSRTDRLSHCIHYTYSAVSIHPIAQSQLFILIILGVAMRDSPFLGYVYSPCSNCCPLTLHTDKAPSSVLDTLCCDSASLRGTNRSSLLRLFLKLLDAQGTKHTSRTLSCILSAPVFTLSNPFCVAYLMQYIFALYYS